MQARNEQEVVFLFCRNYKKLGFEKVVKFNPSSTPDCIAIKDGKQVGIEFEYKLTSFLRHYEYKRFPSKNLFTYKILKNHILIFKKDKPSKIEARLSVKDYEIMESDLNKKSGVNTKAEPLIIKFRSLAESIPYVICWQKNCKLNDDIQVIELKDMKLD